MRWRRGIKWLCTLLAIAIAFALVASMRWSVSVTYQDTRTPTPRLRIVRFEMGMLKYVRNLDGVALDVPSPYWDTSVTKASGRLDWLPQRFKSQYIDCWFVPLWLPLILFAVPASLLWWSDIRKARRVRKGHCPSCGYDRRGLSGPCPECGRPAAPQG